MSVEGKGFVGGEFIKKELARYRSVDDVFREEFLSGVIFTEVDAGFEVTPEAIELLKSLETTWIEVLEYGTTKDTPAPGPYITYEGQLLEVFRLYDDTQGAFVTSVVPDTES